jgi:FKBP-type peptidyl-prolyl cis-trans isomerase FklB
LTGRYHSPSRTALFRPCNPGLVLATGEGIRDPSYMKHRLSSEDTKPIHFLSSVALVAVALLLAACGKDNKDAVKAPASGVSAAKPAGAVPGFESDEQRVSYGIGFNFGSSIGKQKDFIPDRNALKAGLEDGLAGSKTRISETDIQAAFATVQQKMAAANAAAGEKNIAISAAFLAKNKTRAGVTTTASGLQYEVLVHGKGPKPKATDTVEVHYHGTLVDGTVFDSSVERGEPATFPVGQVIKGWVEALQLMSVGDKWKLYVSPDLGYGPRAAGKIPPNSALIFEVQLLSIK